MGSIDLAAYKNLYLQTAREHLSGLKKNLQLLNQDTANQQIVYELFRLFHSLKSQNYFMGFEKNAHLCKLFEGFFREIKEQKRIYDPVNSILILKAVALLENSLDLIEKESKEIDLSGDIINFQDSLR